jgi:hypothetical protein
MCIHQIRIKDKSNDSKDSFYEELEPVVNHSPKYRVKILLDFSSEVGREDILLKQAIGNENLFEISTDNGIRVVLPLCCVNKFVESMTVILTII